MCDVYDCASALLCLEQARVDDSKERFTHGRPDGQLLQTFCREKFGWAPDKVDQILEPVLKVGCLQGSSVQPTLHLVSEVHCCPSPANTQAYDAREAQTTMDSFLSFSQRFAKIRSKRLAKAVTGISKAPNLDVFIDLPAGTPTKAGRKKRKAPPALEQAAAAVTAAAQGVYTGE